MVVKISRRVRSFHLGIEAPLSISVLRSLSFQVRPDQTHFLLSTLLYRVPGRFQGECLTQPSPHPTPQSSHSEPKLDSLARFILSLPLFFLVNYMFL